MRVLRQLCCHFRFRRRIARFLRLPHSYLILYQISLIFQYFFHAFSFFSLSLPPPFSGHFTRGAARCAAVALPPAIFAPCAMRAAPAKDSVTIVEHAMPMRKGLRRMLMSFFRPFIFLLDGFHFLDMRQVRPLVAHFTPAFADISFC